MQLRNFNTEGFFSKLAANANEGENKKMFTIGLYIYHMYIFYGRNVNTEYNYELVRTAYEFENT